MINMKKTIVTLVSLLVIFTASNAQTSALTLEASQLFSSFAFVESNDVKLTGDYNFVITGGYAVGYHYAITDQVFARASIGKRNAGATLVIDETNYTWDLQYIDVRAGAGFQYSLGNLAPYITLSGYYGSLLKGEQLINNELIDTKDRSVLKNSEFGVVVTPGVNLELSGDMTAFFELKYIQGLSNVDENTSQNALNYSFAPTVGIAFTIE